MMMRRTVWMWRSSCWRGRGKKFPDYRTEHPRHPHSTIQLSSHPSKSSPARLLHPNARQSVPRAESPIPRGARGSLHHHQEAEPTLFFLFMKEAPPLWVVMQPTALKTTKALAARVINASDSRRWPKKECSNRTPWMIITFGSVLSKPANMFSR